MNFSLLATITGLALVDSINVCAFAVLAMVLVTILIQYPDKRKKILTTGISFVTAVYVMYFAYGFFIYQFLQGVARAIQGVSAYFFDTLVILIMIIGALNIKDYFMYKPGGLATEMPIFMRPKVKKLINKITSPKGAFVVGLFVTLFLLPCTIAPLIATIGRLVDLGYAFARTIPWLLYYNFLFVTPMLIIVGLIYFGFKKVEDVSGWKERNIKILHLIAGIILLALGIGLLAGWI